MRESIPVQVSPEAEPNDGRKELLNRAVYCAFDFDPRTHKFLGLCIGGYDKGESQEYATFNNDCRHSLKGILLASNLGLGLDNVVIISPRENLTSEKIKEKLLFIKDRIREEPLIAFFLIIIGHQPMDMPTGNHLFRVGDNSYVEMNDVKEIVNELNYCPLIYTIKDMCSAARFNLLPDSDSVGNSDKIRVQWSSCQEGGKSYRSPVIDGRLFSQCLAMGIARSDRCFARSDQCPNNETNCNICYVYQRLSSGKPSYRLLQYFIYEHMLSITGVENNVDLPVLEINGENFFPDNYTGINVDLDCLR